MATATDGLQKYIVRYDFTIRLVSPQGPQHPANHRVGMTAYFKSLPRFLGRNRVIRMSTLDGIGFEGLATLVSDACLIEKQEKEEASSEGKKGI